MICLAGIFLGSRLVFTAEKWCASRRTNLHFPRSALVNWHLRMAGPVVLLRDRCVKLLPPSGLLCSPVWCIHTTGTIPAGTQLAGRSSWSRLEGQSMVKWCQKGEEALRHLIDKLYAMRMMKDSLVFVNILMFEIEIKTHSCFPRHVAGFFKLNWNTQSGTPLLEFSLIWDYLVLFAIGQEDVYLFTIQ